MMILYFYENFFIYLLLDFAYWWIAINIPPLMPFSTLNNISISVNSSNFTSVFFKAACYTNLGTESFLQELIDKYLNI